MWRSWGVNFADWLMWEAKDSPSSLHPPQLQRFDSNSDLYEQVDTFEEEEEVNVLDKIDRY